MSCQCRCCREEIIKCWFVVVVLLCGVCLCRRLAIVVFLIIMLPFYPISFPSLSYVQLHNSKIKSGSACELLLHDCSESTVRTAIIEERAYNLFRLLDVRFNGDGGETGEGIS